MHITHSACSRRHRVKVIAGGEEEIRSMNKIAIFSPRFIYLYLFIKLFFPTNLRICNHRGNLRDIKVTILDNETT